MINVAHYWSICPMIVPFCSISFVPFQQEKKRQRPVTLGSPNRILRILKLLQGAEPRSRRRRLPLGCWCMMRTASQIHTNKWWNLGKLSLNLVIDWSCSTSLGVVDPFSCWGVVVNSMPMWIPSLTFARCLIQCGTGVVASWLNVTSSWSLVL